MCITISIWPEAFWSKLGTLEIREMKSLPVVTYLLVVKELIIPVNQVRRRLCIPTIHRFDIINVYSSRPENTHHQNKMWLDPSTYEITILYTAVWVLLLYIFIFLC